MHHLRARAAGLTLLAMALLTGCMRADADLVIDADTDSVTGSITIAAPLAEDTAAAREAAAAVAVAIEVGALPELRDQSGVTAEAYQGDGVYGTRLLLQDVSIEDFYVGSRLAESRPVITRDGDTYNVAARIDAMTAVGIAPNLVEGARPDGAAESQITITMTFPGEVTSVAGTVEAATIEGNTITWTSSWDQVLELDATAAARESSFPPWIWQAVIWGAIGIGALALLGLSTVWFRSRND